MAGTTRATSGRSGGGNPKPVEGAPASEPDAGPATASGVSSANPTPPVPPAPPTQPEQPEQPSTPERAPRLGERLGVFDVGRALVEGYACRAVAMVQGALSGLGYDPGPFDGLGLSRTRSALEAFARDREIELTDLVSLAEALDALGFDV